MTVVFVDLRAAWIENSRERNPFWETSSRLAIQNNPLLLRNANISCCVQESLSLDPILSHMDLVQTWHPVQESLALDPILSHMDVVHTSHPVQESLAVDPILSHTPHTLFKYLIFTLKSPLESFRWSRQVFRVELCIPYVYLCMLGAPPILSL
jgi:hypothetical protein